MVHEIMVREIPVINDGIIPINEKTLSKIENGDFVKDANRLEESASWQLIKEQLNHCNSVRDETGLQELEKYFWHNRKPEFNTESENNSEIPSKKTFPKQKNFEDVEFKYNPFAIPASFFEIDLLTDSGTSELTAEQIDFKKTYFEKVSSIEIFSYACSTPRRDLEMTMKICFGEEFNFYPALQGRAAEKMLLTALLQNGVLPSKSCILSNRPFDTTKGHIMGHGLTVKELTPLSSPEKYYNSDTPFMGDIDPLKFESEQDFTCLLMTMTDNGGGGQPVSLKNLELLAAKTHAQNKLVWVDGCRIYENACFIKALDPAYKTKSLNDIVKEVMKIADVVTVSFKKMYSHSGGGIFINRNSKILTKKQMSGMAISIQSKTTADYGNGYNSYSGLTGDGIVEIISGLILCLNESVVARRIVEVCYVGSILRKKFNLPILSGGHALYIAADQVIPSLPLEHCPAEYLNAIMMKSLRVRGCGLGNLVYGGRHADSSGDVAFSKELPMDSLRLAVPREVYNREHLLRALSVVGVAYQIGFFDHLTGGLTPLDYVDNGFYHFGAKYELNDEEEFNETVKRMTLLTSLAKSAKNQLNVETVRKATNSASLDKSAVCSIL